MAHSIFLVSFLFFYFFETSNYAQEEMRTALHVHSTVSGDPLAMSEIAYRAQKLGIDAVILTDYLEQKAELRLFPHNAWLKLWHDKKSVLKTGLKRYLSEIESINKKYQGVLLIPGYEVTPAYWWSGNLFTKNLTLHDFQKNLLIFGISEEAVNKIPTMHNGLSKSNPYRGMPGIKPYQQVIDFVDQESGIVLWSTPDENPGTQTRQGKIYLQTPLYYEDLLKTERYSGIAVLPEGNIYTGIPGGVWDQVLEKYSRGRRERPCWVFSELILHQIRETDLDHRLLISWVNKKNELELLKSIHAGRFYALQKGKTKLLRIGHFEITTDLNQMGVSGETVLSASTHKISAEIGVEGNPSQPIEWSLIRMGEVIAAEVTTGKAQIAINATWPPDEKKIYYRLTAKTLENGPSIVMSNPIFVERSHALTNVHKDFNEI